MLEPSDRHTLIDAMRPPAGHRFDEAMAVTFTLDLRALLAAPAAFALAPVDERDDDADGPEPIELIHAIRAHAGNITVFSEAGEIALPPARKVFAFLERCVVPVTAPRHGVVHPKVWVLRYLPIEDDGAPVHRVLIASRNLTFDTSWDTLLRLDQASSPRGADLGPIADLFDTLVAQAVGPVGDDHRARVASLGRALREVRFALPLGVESLRMHVMGAGGVDRPLPADPDRTLVVSPFLSADFFTSVHPHPIEVLVSRSESIDGLPVEVAGSIAQASVIDDDLAATDTEADADLTPADPGNRLEGLHAKIFLTETGSRARLFVGSANASGAAFGQNLEVLAELEGPVSSLGIDRLLHGDGDQVGLGAILLPYRRSEHPAELSDDGSPPDGLRRAIGRLGIAGVVDPSATGWAIRYRSEHPVPVPDGVELTCWPIASAGNRLRVPGGHPLDLRFEVTLETISGFVGFEAIEVDTGLCTRFAVPAVLEGVPDDRERLLLRSLIGSAERFLRYLLALLDDESTGEAALDTIADIEGSGDRRAATGSLPVLEKLVRTVRRDPDKLLALDPLVRDLAADDALPDGFGAVWAVLRPRFGIEETAR
ncbi:MAG: phospholipase D family protein [Acidimicrobiales bacterium]|nr:phospholipase D family protein [Acidimicrobiales bacterium]